ncbi:electron transport complex subunit RsxC [Vibrio mediterranei]|uniref:Ion-translocating oxidoreductase complex subunit C n=1 Tax=Vibrio mediterranei TaxID=689 RepID=A0ABX5DEY6_9VIBR|nr:electron transport complex subunit RsxC [Vibrio mediterranei]PCD88720.1 electron transport complex subunit RsxC [Vibrio mediterranei]PRQ68010.1 electron transport complex subunit RsxC [Vibrio mediterranei]
MLSLIEQIKSGSLWDFPGGVHPQENKKQSNQSSIAKANIPNELVIPLKQHIGKPGDILVTVGERVLKGQPLSQVNAAFMLPIHAPTSGTIKAIEPRTIAHPSGLSDLSIVIEADQQDEWFDLNPCENYLDELPESLIERIRLAGISGMGGAGFPTARKIQSGLQRTEILILNAAECEPYITADDRLMQDKTQEVIEGIKILNHILKPKLTIIGIEDNKPEAIKALEQAATDEDIVIRVIPTKYPSGGEKQLIKILTNLEVPVGGIPADIGLMVQNVGSAYAIKRAVCDGEPLIERVVTLTGKTFKQPRNVWALIGTPVQSLLDQFGYKADKKSPRLIMGGPMMGFTLPHANVPITKTANCILAPTYREIDPRSHEMSCIRCSQCAEACPASLLPQQLQWYAKSQEYDKCEELNLKDCIECGACAFVCPSEIPLVHYYRQAKAEIRTRKQESEAAERAKVRFEEKKARLERDKADRENRFKKAADDRRKQMKSSGGDDAIAAAIERVKAQKSTSATNEVKPAVAAAIARAKAKQAEAAKQGQTGPDNSEMAKLREERKRLARERKANKPAEADNVQNLDNTEQDPKKAAIAAALARAKAKKAAQQLQAEESSGEESQTSKKDAVAAAIARAKARKQAATEAEPETQDTDAPAKEDPKKAAVAAAIARAKARKQAAVETESETQDTDAPAEDDPKKAAVAAAIARAKARKQAAVETESETQDTDAPAEEDPKKAAVAAAIARAKARKQAAVETEPETQNTDAPAEDDPKKAAVAAAIARAKARKQAAVETKPEIQDSDAPAEDDPKKAAVAAAIARAKARKQASVETEPETQDTDAPAEDDPKKAAVAAAIARAKARKQAAVETEPEIQDSDVPAEDDPKKAAVAAAIARAKARKIEKEQNNKENN